MLRVFVGYDPRQPIAYHVLAHSIMRHTSEAVALVPLMLDTLPIEREGLTEFTYSRYLVPHLCGYQGKAIFLDSDMLVLGDISELDTDEAVSVVKFPEHRYEWPSVMVFDCAKCRDLSPEYIEVRNPQDFEWGEVGELDPNWNFLVGYEHPRVGVKLLHYTQGIPHYKECRMCDYAENWFNERDLMLDSVSWLEIMGRSVHAEPVLERLSG